VVKKKASSTSRRRTSGASSKRSAKSSKSNRASAQRKSARKSTRSTASRDWSLSQDRKLDLIGLLLVGLSLFTIYSLLTNQESLVAGAWLNLLRAIFGWGMFVIPLSLLAVGMWLLLRTFGDRLPHLEAEQIVGIGFLYLALLILMHVSIGAGEFAEGMEQARIGRGGGVIGAALLAFLLSTLGIGGTIVALAAWILLGVAFTAGLSIPDLLTMIIQWSHRVRARIVPTRGRPPAQPSRVAKSQVKQAASRTDVAERGVKRGGAIAVETKPVASEWTLPEINLILDAGVEGRADETFDRERARLIEETLQVFGAPARVVEINRGPTITQFGVEPDFIEGRRGRRTKVKVGKISALADDLALALAASSIRIEAPVPGKGYVGIEVPNQEVSLVALRDVMKSDTFQDIYSRLRLGLGMDVSGRAIAADLAAMPHLLIAGTTGSGKSVCVNTIISSLLLQNTPDELKFVMVDPKRVELTYYNGIPHLLAPVVVELDRVVSALQWVSREMDERYHRFAKEGVRNITDFNQLMLQLDRKLMYTIVVVIDELADLMIMAPDETERLVTRLAQLARATGIHLVIATQRPSVDVVTGLIKANFPARIAFAVASSVDSRVILDQPGAERLLGRGDMLFQAPDAAAPVRMQGSFVSEVELERLIQYWKNAALGSEVERVESTAPAQAIPPGTPLTQVPLWDEKSPPDDEADPIYNEAVNVVREMRRASISLLQRRLRIGYTRAARLVDQLETQGIIGPARGGSQPREVLDYGPLSQIDED
jgi:S-DNA-T family DNA segregation ATPase FtsK/SpoIIIE